MKIFEIVGQNFFALLNSKYKQIYIDCAEIIYKACSTELTYSVDREIIVEKLSDYFESDNQQFESEEDLLRDSRAKACKVLRDLEHCNWIEVESDYKQTTISIMDYAVSMLKTFTDIVNQEEMEYRTEISQIYATLTNPEFSQYPYSLVIVPVSQRTEELISGLKRLNTSIKKYVSQMLEKTTFNGIMDNFSLYVDSNVSSAYHRLVTSENISKYRLVIIEKIQEIRSNKDVFAKAVAEYMEQKKVEEDVARNELQEILLRILSVFNSYDDLIREVEKKNTRYIQSASDRIKFLSLNSNDVETRISVILQKMQKEIEEGEDDSFYISDEDSSIFNLFPQSFLSNDSFSTIPSRRKKVEIEKITSAPLLSEEEKMMKTATAYALIDSDFDVNKVNEFIFEKMKEKEKIKVSEMEMGNEKEFMKVLYSLFFVKDRKAKYQISFLETPISKCGWKFRDFEIEKKK